MKKKVFIPLAITAAIVVAGASLVTAIVLKKPGKIDGFDKAVTSLSEIEIPEGTRIVALGEATHGNKEFQELKLELFQKLVEKNDIRALVLEGEAGGCAIANRYIQGGEGSAEEATKHLGYRLYRTDQMCELVQWMHDYNETAAEGDKVRLYGMDIQRHTDSVAYLTETYESLDPLKAQDYSSRMENVIGTEDYEYASVDLNKATSLMDEILADLKDHSAEYEEKIGKTALSDAEYSAESIKSCMEYYLKDQATHKARDSRMKENVDRILKLEEDEYKSEIMMSCHNGHMTQIQANQVNFLGTFLNETYGESYFAIGTDYYKTTVNLPSESGRTNVQLDSGDPLAYQVKKLDGNEYYLDFSKVDKSSKLGQTVSSPLWMGSVGEANSPLYKVSKAFRSIYNTPSELYDAMVLYYEVTPTEIWDD